MKITYHYYDILKAKGTKFHQFHCKKNRAISSAILIVEHAHIGVLPDQIVGYYKDLVMLKYVDIVAMNQYHFCLLWDNLFVSCTCRCSANRSRESCVPDPTGLFSSWLLKTRLQSVYGSQVYQFSIIFVFFKQDNIFVWNFQNVKFFKDNFFFLNKM